MFNNSLPNIILLTDKTDIIGLNKTLGPYKIAHVLRTHGFEVAVVNHLSTFSIGEIKHLLTHLISDQTLMIGINNFWYANIGQIIGQDGGGVTTGSPEFGAMVPHGKRFNQELRELIRQKNSQCVLVQGGPGADDLEYNNIFDYIVVGYAECSMVNLAKHLQNTAVTLEKSYRSIFGPIIVNDSRAEQYNFAQGTMRYEDHDVILHGETVVLEVARGCIFKCKFCSYPMNGKKKLDFIRSSENIYSELMDNFKRFGTTRYIFSDDTFNDSVEKCKMIHDISKRLPFKLEWWGYIRLDLLAAHPETIDWLLVSGLKSAWFGIETFHDKAASFIGKGGDREKQMRVLREIKHKHGDSVALHGSFIFGLPHEPLDSFVRTGDFLLSDSNPLDSWLIQPLVIRPTDRNYSNGFVSDIDLNWAKYGYQNVGKKFFNNRLDHQRHESGKMIWQNQHTDFLEVESLVSDLVQQRRQQNRTKVAGMDSFMISGLGVELDLTLNKLLSDVDWSVLDQKKIVRASEYKKTLFEHLSVPLDCQLDISDGTYSEWLRSQQHLVDCMLDCAET